jgi:hypothetical protein
MEKLGISETLDVFEAAIGWVKSLAEAYKGDKQIDKMELFRASLANAPASIRAAVGSDKIWPEMQDLDKGESDQLAAKGMELLQALGQFWAVA